MLESIRATARISFRLSIIVPLITLNAVSSHAQSPRWMYNTERNYIAFTRDDPRINVPVDGLAVRIFCDRGEPAILTHFRGSNPIFNTIIDEIEGIIDINDILDDHQDLIDIELHMYVNEGASHSGDNKKKSFPVFYYYDDAVSVPSLENVNLQGYLPSSAFKAMISSEENINFIFNIRSETQISTYPVDGFAKAAVSFLLDCD